MVVKNYIVSPRHEANVPVKMSDKDIPHPADNWVIETKQLSSRVMIARTLINGNQKRLVARVCNYSLVRLFAGSWYYRLGNETSCTECLLVGSVSPIGTAVLELPLGTVICRCVVSVPDQIRPE